MMANNRFEAVYELSRCINCGYQATHLWSRKRNGSLDIDIRSDDPMIVLIAEVDAAGRVSTTRCQHFALQAFYMRRSPATTEAFSITNTFSKAHRRRPHERREPPSRVPCSFPALEAPGRSTSLP